MSLLAPAALGLAALAIPLIALYMLRSRRRSVEVPSIMLWSRVGPSVSSAVPWQRLRITPLLLLQLLILALFVAALARPFFEEDTLLGPHTVLVIDTSGSMAMAGRFDDAQRRALDLAADASAANLISVVEAGPSPRILAAFSQDADTLASRIGGLAVTGGGDDLAAALRLARGLSSPDRPTSILLLSDGGPPADAGPVEEPAPGVRHLLFDRFEDNVAITAFAADPAATGTPVLFVEASNFGDRAATADVELAVGGVPAGSVTIELAPRARGRRTVPVEAGSGDVVTARLASHDDGLALDDAATAVLGSGPARTAAIAGEGSVFLDALVESAPGFAPALGAVPDVVIVDGGDEVATELPTWFIAPTTPPDGVTVTGRLENAVVTYQRPGEPLLDAVDLSDLAVAAAQVVEAPGWLPLVRAGDVPLVLLGEVDGRRAVYFTFDLTHSNLPVQVAFPILGSRLLEWLAGGPGFGAATATAGTPIPVAPPAGGWAEVIMPDGERRALEPGTTLFTDTGVPGLYRVEYLHEDGTLTAGPLAARQFAAAESEGGARPLATTAPAGATTDAGTLVREWAPWVLAALILLGLAEWWLGHGRPLPRRAARRAA